MPKFSKSHNSGNTVYKVAFPVAIEKLYNGGRGGGGREGGTGYFPGGNSTTVPENCSHFSGGKFYK